MWLEIARIDCNSCGEKYRAIWYYAKMHRISFSLLVVLQPMEYWCQYRRSSSGFRHSLARSSLNLRIKTAFSQPWFVLLQRCLQIESDKMAPHETYFFYNKTIMFLLQTNFPSTFLVVQNLSFKKAVLCAKTHASMPV